LRAPGESYEKNQGAAFRLNSPSQSWLGVVGPFVVVGIAYFLAARVGVLLGVSQGVPIFWPAAGIAVGAFITLGPNARLPVAVAVVAATIASGMLIGRSLSLTITFAFFNTGEALLTAWLIERWFGCAFTLETVRQVLGFVVASAVSEAIAASGAGIVVHFLEPTTSSAHAWRLWFASCSLGIFTVAPLLIGLGEIVRELPPRRELIEGTVGLATLAAVSVFVISQPQSPWATALPVALVLPVVLWIAVRCRPGFAAAAMFIVALAVIWSTTFDVGHFADASVPLSDRILAAQTLVLAAALLALVLAALFAERRRSEAALKQGRERLRLALDGAELGAFSADFTTGRLECDARAAQIHGQNVPPMTMKESRRFVHPDDLARIDAALAEAQRTGGIWNTEYRVVPPPDHPHAGETRWVAVEGSIVRDAHGVPMQLLGVTRDITLSKRGEQALAERNTQLALAGKVGGIGSFAFDIATGKMQVSAGYVAIHGLPEGTRESTRAEWRCRVHADDLPRLENNLRQDIAERHLDHFCEYRIVRPDGKIRWIEARSLIAYDAQGCAQRVVGANIDVTERKRSQEHQHVLHAELDHRVKNVLATVSTIAARTMDASSSMQHFVASLDGRIRSMARTHELLSAARWQGISVLELVRRELAPYATRGNTAISGPAVILKSEAGQAMGMVLHELATNAAKYGALSAQNGRVSIRWKHRSNGHPRSHLVLDWLEIGGPSVVAPAHSGFGTSTIRDLIPYEFGGTVGLAFAPSGVRCRLELPADWLINNDEPLSPASQTAAKLPRR
jgi:PAS domain S-box-containing protein